MHTWNIESIECVLRDSSVPVSTIKLLIIKRMVMFYLNERKAHFLQVRTGMCLRPCCPTYWILVACVPVSRDLKQEIRSVSWNTGDHITSSQKGKIWNGYWGITALWQEGLGYTLIAVKSGRGILIAQIGSVRWGIPKCESPHRIQVP